MLKILRFKLWSRIAKRASKLDKRHIIAFRKTTWSKIPFWNEFK